MGYFFSKPVIVDAEEWKRILGGDYPLFESVIAKYLATVKVSEIPLVKKIFCPCRKLDLPPADHASLIVLFRRVSPSHEFKSSQGQDEISILV